MTMWLPVVAGWTASTTTTGPKPSRTTCGLPSTRACLTSSATTTSSLMWMGWRRIPPESSARLAQLDSANRYYNNLKNLQRNSPNLPGNIAAGINVFLMVTDVNPLVRRVFCPPKEAYDPEQNADFRYGRPLPPLNDLVESSKVIALKLPVSGEEKLARIMGTLLK